MGATELTADGSGEEVQTTTRERRFIGPAITQGGTAQPISLCGIYAPAAPIPVGQTDYALTEARVLQGSCTSAPCIARFRATSPSGDTARIDCDLSRQGDVVLVTECSPFEELPPALFTALSTTIESSLGMLAFASAGETGPLGDILSGESVVLTRTGACAPGIAQQPTTTPGTPSNCTLPEPDALIVDALTERHPDHTRLAGPEVAFSPDGRYAVAAWARARRCGTANGLCNACGTSKIYLATLDTSVSKSDWNGPILLRTLNQPVSTVPQLSVDNQGNVQVFYVDSAPAAPRLVQHSCPVFTGLQCAEPVTVFPFQPHGFKVAAADNGRILAVGYLLGSYRFRYRVREPSGQWGPIRLMLNGDLPETSVSSYSPSSGPLPPLPLTLRLSLNRVGTRAALAWTTTDKLLGQLIDPVSQATLSSALTLKAFPDDEAMIQARPQVATDNGKGVVFQWHKGNGLFAKRVFNGTVRAEEALSPANASTTFGRTALAVGGSAASPLYMLVWQSTAGQVLARKLTFSTAAAIWGAVQPVIQYPAEASPPLAAIGNGAAPVGLAAYGHDLLSAPFIGSAWAPFGGTFTDVQQLVTPSVGGGLVAVDLVPNSLLGVNGPADYNLRYLSLAP